MNLYTTGSSYWAKNSPPYTLVSNILRYENLTFISGGSQKDPYTAVAYLYAYDGNNLIWTTEYPSVPAWIAGMTFQTISDDGYLIVGGFVPELPRTSCLAS